MRFLILIDCGLKEIFIAHGALLASLETFRYYTHVGKVQVLFMGDAKYDARVQNSFHMCESSDNIRLNIFERELEFFIRRKSGQACPGEELGYLGLYD